MNLESQVLNQESHLLNPESHLLRGLGAPGCLGQVRRVEFVFRNCNYGDEVVFVGVAFIGIAFVGVVLVRRKGLKGWRRKTHQTGK